MIKFTAANAVTHRPGTIVEINDITADLANAESAHRLQGMLTGIVSEIQLQGLNYGRCDPSRTGFITWKNLFVHDDNIQPGLTQAPGQR